MKDKPISPVIVTFKSLAGVRLQAIESNGCKGCRLPFGWSTCIAEGSPNGDCADRGYIWREVPPKEGK